METLKNEPVILTGNGQLGGGTGHGSDGLLSTILLASLLGGSGLNKGCGFSPSLVDMGTLFNEKSAADTRRDVKESESEIRESIHNQTIANLHAIDGLDCKLNSIEKSAIESKYENQLATKDMTFALNNKIDCETNMLKLQNFQMQTNIDKQFCDLTHRLDRSFAELKERELENENHDLRRENIRLRDINQTNDIVAAVVRAMSCVAAPVCVPTPVSAESSTRK